MLKTTIQLRTPLPPLTTLTSGMLSSSQPTGNTATPPDGWGHGTGSGHAVGQVVVGYEDDLRGGFGNGWGSACGGGFQGGGDTGRGYASGEGSSYGYGEGWGMGIGDGSGSSDGDSVKW